MKKVFVVLAVVLLAGCGSKKVDTLAGIRREGVLRAAVLEDAQPYSSFNMRTGTYEGSDIDLINAIAASLDVTVEFVPCGRKEFVAAIQSGTAHVALGRIPDTECRATETNNSIAYGSGYIYAVTPRGKFTSTLGSLEGMTIGASVELSDSANMALYGVTDILVQPYAELTNIEANLLNKTIDAYVCYEQQALSLTQSEALQAEMIVNAAIENYVILFPRGDSAMADFINQAITEYAGESPSL